MKRPNMTVERLGIADPKPETGETAIHLVDANGNSQIIFLPPQLRINLSLGLLAGALIDSAAHKGTPQFLIDASNLRLYADQEGTTCLEVQLNPLRAVHIRLGGLLPEALLQLLRGWSPTPKPGSAAH